jgi:hypothetical protein
MFVLLWVMVYGTSDHDPIISQAGGQTWTKIGTEPTQVHPNGHFALFHCVFNGTWSADPSVNFQGTAGTYPVCMWLGAFTGVNTSDPFDVAPSAIAYAVSSSKTLSAITTTTNRALALHLWGEIDDNTMLLSNGDNASRPWSAPDGNMGALHGHVGNIGGSDCGIMALSRSIIVAGSSGTAAVTMSTSDAGGGYDLALKSAADAIYPTCIGTYVLGSTGTSHVIPTPTGIASGDLMLAFLATTSSNTITAPDGWSLVDDEINGNYHYLVYSKVAGSSEPTDYTWTSVSSCKYLGYITGFDGTAGTPVVETSNTVAYGGTSTVVLPSLTAAGAALSVLFGCAASALDKNLWHPQEYSKWYYMGDNAADFWAGVWSKTVAAGATGTQTLTPTAALDSAGGIHVLLKAPTANASKPYYYAMNNQL